MGAHGLAGAGIQDIAGPFHPGAGARRFGLYAITLFAAILFHPSDCAAGFFLFDKGSRCEAAAERSGFRKELIGAGGFTLLAYSRIAKPGQSITIYIEGDGSAWESRTRLAGDPTPRDTIVIDLAAADPSPNVIYLARPGQYTLAGASECSPSYWSNGRFSETAVNAMDQAVGRLKSKYGAPDISLIGYSGGAAVAVLIAARRDDVSSLRTVAGNLDAEAVARYHKVSPLTGSLNPIDAAKKIKGLPQRHFAGSEDTVVPLFIAQSFVKRAGDGNDERITVVDGATHTKGWRERWRELLRLRQIGDPSY